MTLHQVLQWSTGLFYIEKKDMMWRRGAQYVLHDNANYGLDTAWHLAKALDCIARLRFYLPQISQIPTDFCAYLPNLQEK